jgi:hypothetical protein
MNPFATDDNRSPPPTQASLGGPDRCHHGQNYASQNVARPAPEGLFCLLFSYKGKPPPAKTRRSPAPRRGLQEGEQTEKRADRKTNEVRFQPRTRSPLISPFPDRPPFLPEFWPPRAQSNQPPPAPPFRIIPPCSPPERETTPHYRPRSMSSIQTPLGSRARDPAQSADALQTCERQGRTGCDFFSSHGGAVAPKGGVRRDLSAQTSRTPEDR